jgi:hypothetical protein
MYWVTFEFPGGGPAVYSGQGEIHQDQVWQFFPGQF